MSLQHHKLGHGPNILLAFHGIGQDGVSCFKPFEEKLGHYYTIYAFDLFFHGESVNLEIDLVTKIFWDQLIENFLTENSIAQFDIAGFSMGGRFALATLEGLPNQIKNVFLIAPDGVSQHPLYTLATKFKLTRQLFQWTMNNPAIFFCLINSLKSLRLINSSLVRFTEQVLNTPEKRQTIYKSWTAFRELRFDIPKVYNLAVANNVRIFLFTGTFDKLLKPGAVKPLSDLLPPNRNIIFKSGHSQLVAQSGAWICTLFE